SRAFRTWVYNPVVFAGELIVALLVPSPRVTLEGASRKRLTVLGTSIERCAVEGTGVQRLTVHNEFDHGSLEGAGIKRLELEGEAFVN
ncbi:hypothetical protein, partial [Lactococcus petauri]|uniref:hypothetical protein n=1 Tax=Lactococcus petauri TaxID=1940789 RepID=UPI0021F22B98